MRLGQLARQLSIKPDEIVKFLASKDIIVEGDNNARVDDSLVAQITKHFAPDIEPSSVQISERSEEPAPESGDGDAPQASPETLVPEVIKAPKIELPGLRVVGKIELPEKKKTEPPTPESEPEQIPIPAPRKPQRFVQPRESKNPIAMAREREEREKQRKLTEQREKEKQRKTEFYLKRLKPQPPTKAVRMINEEYSEMPPLQRERPKTWWGRFMRWLNT